MDILVLKFDSAKLFMPSMRSKDRVLDISDQDYSIKGNNTRLKSSSRVSNYMIFKDLIVGNHVSNVLHVLCGERPVPSHRHVFYSKNEKLFNIAMGSMIEYVDLDVISQSEKEKKSKLFGNFFGLYGELINTNKSVYNAINPNVNINWLDCKTYFNFGGESFILYKRLLSLLTGIGDVEKHPLRVIRSKVMESPLFDEYVDKLKSINGDYHCESELDEIIQTFAVKHRGFKAYLFSFFFDNALSAINVKKHFNRTVVSGVDKVHTLQGKLYIPLEDDYLLNKIKINACTILDGGLVTIEGVYDEDELFINGDLIKVSELSNTPVNYIEYMNELNEK